MPELGRLSGRPILFPTWQAPRAQAGEADVIPASSSRLRAFA
jgi:hypothetical protein